MACKQHSKSVATSTSRWPVLSAFLLIILPKCPYCLIAYSSAITICGLPAESNHGWESYLIAGLILVILVSLLISYRGARTLIALALLITGSICMIWSLNMQIISLYHTGSVMLLLAALVNRKIFKFQNKAPFLKPL